MPGKTALEMNIGEWQQYRPFHTRKKSALETQRSSEARRLAETLAIELRERFGAEQVTLFGSLARGELTDRSDIDLAVWGIPPQKFYRAVAFVSGFSAHWRIDLVDGDDCSSSLLRSIEQEGIAL